MSKYQQQSSLDDKVWTDTNLVLNSKKAVEEYIHDLQSKRHIVDWRAGWCYRTYPKHPEEPQGLYFRFNLKQPKQG